MKNSTILLNQKNSEQAEILNPSIIVYTNAETDKSLILTENKGKAGIYQWTHTESGKIYIGSAFDLSKRLNHYFSKSYLNRHKYMYINNALLLHGHSAFSLEILEYVNISNLSLEDARKLILEREQNYLDECHAKKVITYNILKIAGSSLGHIHIPETKEKMSAVKKGKAHPLFGKTHPPEIRAKISAKTREAMSDPAIRSKMSVPKSEAHKTKISVSKGTVIFVYDTKGSLSNTFCSAREAGKHFDCTFNTILKYAKNGELFQDEWILSTSVKK